MTTNEEPVAAKTNETRTSARMTREAEAGAEAEEAAKAGAKAEAGAEAGTGTGIPPEPEPAPAPRTAAAHPNVAAHPDRAAHPGRAAHPDAGASSGAASADDGADSPGPSLTDLERRANAAARERPYGDDALIVCDRLVRIFSADGVEIQALQGLDLLVREGELTALVGASGSGKSTLLNILAGLDTPSAGSATVAGYDLLTMNAASRLRYRREIVGFIWQRTSRNLLPYLTAAQNVTLPMKPRGGRSGPRGGRAKTRRAMELLDLLGMADGRDRRPAQLSGGEQQRVAIAVALANSPSVILADEPTGELDTDTAEEVFTALRRANSELGTTILVVTHDNGVSTQVGRTVSIRDGRTSTETLRRPEPGTESGPVGRVHPDSGGAALVSREYATVDRSGRLQLPPEFTEPLGIRDRALLELRSEYIEVRPVATRGTHEGREDREDRARGKARGADAGASGEGPADAAPEDSRTG